MTLPPNICKQALFRSKWGRLTPAVRVGFIRLAVSILGHSPLQLDTGQCKTKIRHRLPSLSSLKWSFLCCIGGHLTIRNVSELHIPQKSRFTQMFSLVFPSPGPHTQLILHFSQLKWPSLELSPLFYTLHQELMFQYADTGYTFQSGMLHVYFISENSLAVKMCVKRLATKLCICCLFCPGSIRHLFCTEILIKLFHFSLFFFLIGFYIPPTHTFFFLSQALEVKAGVSIVLFWSHPPSGVGRKATLCAWNYSWDSGKGEQG